MANYTGSHVPKLSHLRQLAVQVQSAIGEVAQAAADAVTAVAAAKADKVEVVSLSIPASGWSTDSTAACPCYKDVVAVVVAPSSTAVAAAAGLATTESRAGVLRLRAQRAPTAAISASYYIIR